MASLAMGHWGTCPLEFWKFRVFCTSLTVQISKIAKEKHVLHFHLFRQKHAKTHVSRLKQSRTSKRNPGKKRREKILLCPLASFPGGAPHCLQSLHDLTVPLSTTCKGCQVLHYVITSAIWRTSAVTYLRQRPEQLRDRVAVMSRV